MEHHNKLLSVSCMQSQPEVSHSGLSIIRSCSLPMTLPVNEWASIIKKCSRVLQLLLQVQPEVSHIGRSIITSLLLFNALPVYERASIIPSEFQVDEEAAES
jgi:hypothetical protein